jgi:hypothetical protein
MYAHACTHSENSYITWMKTPNSEVYAVQFKERHLLTCFIFARGGGFHSGDYRDSRLLGYDVVYTATRTDTQT